MFDLILGESFEIQFLAIFELNLKGNLIDFTIKKKHVLYILGFLTLYSGDASHPNTKYPPILKTPPGAYYLGDRLVIGGRDI